MSAGWRKVGRAAGWGVVLGLAVAVGAEAGSIFLGRNWHVIIPGEAFRSAQLSHDDLLDAIDRHGVRTVVNLRGTSPDLDWYLAESRATRDADISQEDVTLSAYRLPSPDELRRLVDVLDHAEYPLLLHCRQGVDRTGLASAILLLLRTDATPAQARRQLGLRYGHIAIGPTWVMHQCMDLYDAWLRRQDRPHSPDALRQWADHDYCPSYLRGTVELIEPPAMLRVGVPGAVRVRAINTSPEPWAMHPGTETGVYVKFLLFGPDWRLIHIGRAGQFEATIPPNGSVDLTLALPLFAVPGPYHLVADLADGNRYAFSQFGNQPLEVPLTVGAATP